MAQYFVGKNGLRADIPSGPEGKNLALDLMRNTRGIGVIEQDGKFFMPGDRGASQIKPMTELERARQRMQERERAEAVGVKMEARSMAEQEVDAVFSEDGAAGQGMPVKRKRGRPPKARPAV